MPALHLGTQPEHRPARPEVHDWARHVGVARLVVAHRIAVSEAKDRGDVVGIDEVFNEDSARHNKSLHVSADIDVARMQFRPGARVL